MIAKGVRFNAEKKQVGNYYSTKVLFLADCDILAFGTSFEGCIMQRNCDHILLHARNVLLVFFHLVCRWILAIDICTYILAYCSHAIFIYLLFTFVLVSLISAPCA